jgi:hypothetical protein
MPFYILKFKIHSEEADALKDILAHSPNGTPLCCAQAILTATLCDDTRVYWIDNKYASPERTVEVKSLQGVETFKELPYWTYDDHYTESVLETALIRERGKSV